MSNLSRTIVFLLTLTFSGGLGLSPAFSLPLAGKQSLEGNKNPIEITSDRMRSENQNRKIIFSGNVKSQWGDLEIQSDVLEIYTLSPDRKKASANNNFAGNQNLEEIVALGNVRIKKGNRRAKGDKAIYFDRQQKIILTGSPKAVAWDGENNIEGREMIFFLDRDRFVVNERVIFKMYPKNEEPGKRKKSGPSAKRETASNHR